MIRYSHTKNIEFLIINRYSCFSFSVGFELSGSDLVYWVKLILTCGCFKWLQRCIFEEHANLCSITSKDFRIVLYCIVLFFVVAGTYNHHHIHVKFLIIIPSPRDLSTTVYPNHYIILCKFNQTSSKKNKSHALLYIILVPLSQLIQYTDLHLSCDISLSI